MAQIIDNAGIDVILVGDTLLSERDGRKRNDPADHAGSNDLSRGIRGERCRSRAWLSVDLPFGSYQGNSKEALCSAIRIMKETSADAVKLEGGREVVESVTRILSAGIPGYGGHLGLTPQSIHKFGTYVVRAQEDAEAKKLIEDAHLLEELDVLPSCWKRFRQNWLPKSPKN